MITVRSALLLGLAMGVLGCGEDPEAPAGPGTMELRLINPPDHLGIFTVRVRGSVTEAVQAAPGVQVWEREAGADERVILLSGSFESGVVATFDSPDLDAPYEVEALYAAADSAGDYAILPAASVTLWLTRE